MFKESYSPHSEKIGKIVLSKMHRDLGQFLLLKNKEHYFLIDETNCKIILDIKGIEIIYHVDTFLDVLSIFSVNTVSQVEYYVKKLTQSILGNQNESLNFIINQTYSDRKHRVNNVLNYVYPRQTLSSHVTH